MTLIRAKDQQPLTDGNAPHWASGWGQDRFGIFAEFTLRTASDATVTQRLRWLPPGSFQMGSDDPPDSAWLDAKPAHQVRLTNGFWLFDTPCTQGLWNAVMRENPSYFVDDQRPVDSVNWEDCQEFVRRLAGQFEGLSLTLPTEAQWEYACPAGTSTATYAGDMEILGVNNAPVLNEIAWYGGNSGVDFDLENGSDSSGWPDNQFEHNRAGTRKVGQKEPNAWGLYDMLGNVWEWCLDRPRQYVDAMCVDPLGAMKEGADRVVRGGSWSHDAQVARSAFRVAFEPGHRLDYLGFRCVLVQGPS